MSEPNLLPCPFCGGSAQREGDWVFCLKCGVGYEHVNAAWIWNQRAQPTPEAIQRIAHRIHEAIMGPSHDVPATIAEILTEWLTKEKA